MKTTTGQSGNSISAPNRRRRPWRQKLLRAAVMVLLVVGAAYVSLPWWLPVETIRRNIRDDLSRQLGLPVEVGPVSISWSGGVEIDGLKIASPEGFLPGPMIHIERIRCDFSPLEMAVNNRIPWMVLERTYVTIQADREGNLNVAPLGNMVFATETGRISVRQAEVTLRVPDNERLLVLNVGDLELIDEGIEKIGQISMSARLLQSGGAAPVSLHVTGGTGGRARFSFTHIDLGQLPLGGPLFSDLPIRSLAGRCRGRLVFGINDNLKIDKLELELLARNLEVQPKGSPTLPVIDEAGLRISASIDALAQRADIHSLSLRLPGIDLTGQASVFADILTGSPDALESLELAGELRPGQIAALLTGRQQLPHDLAVNGPVKVAINLQRQGHSLTTNITADAARAEVRIGRETLKPAGQPLAFALEGSYNPQMDLLDMEHCRFKWGGNVVTASGTMSGNGDDHALPDEPLAMLMAMAGRLNVRGTVTIAGRNSPGPPDSPTTDPLEFAGTLAGTWSIGGGNGALPRFSTSLHVPRDARFSLGQLLTKPAGEELTLDAGVTIDADKMRLRDILVDFSAAGGRACVDKAWVQLPVPPAGKSARKHLAGSGQVEVENAEHLLKCLQNKDKVMGDADVSGGLYGGFSFSRIDDVRQATLKANLKNLAVAAGKYFVKPAGQPAALSISAGDDGVAFNILTGKADAPDAQLDGQYKFDKKTLRLVGQLPDVAWLATTCPALGKSLDGGYIKGGLKFRGQVQPKGNHVDVRLAVTGEKLDCVVGKAKKRTVNIQGQPVEVIFHGGITESPGWMVINVKQARLAIGKTLAICLSEAWAKFQPKLLAKAVRGKTLSVCLNKANAKIQPKLRARVAGNKTLSVCLSKANAKIQPKLRARAAANAWPIRGLDNLAGIVKISSENIEELLGEWIPPLASLVKKHSLSGAGSIMSGIELADKTFRLAVIAEAGGASAKNIAGFAKPKNLPARLELELAGPSDLSEVNVRKFAGQLGKLHVTAGGRAKIKLRRNGLPETIDPQAGRLTVDLKDAASLAGVLPKKWAGKLAGQALATMAWDAKNGGTVTLATCRANKLRGHFRGKDVLLNGAVRLENVVIPAGELKSLGRIFTDDLEFRAGKNHGWLLADLRDLPTKPRGDFHALFEYIDNKDLTDWVGKTSKAPRGEIPDDERKKLDAQAEKIVKQLQQYARKADIRGRVSAQKFFSYDEKVLNSFPINKMEMRVRVDNGQVEVAYDAGLNGGMIHCRMTTQLKDAQPRVASDTELVEVGPCVALQRQILRDFPGNTVTGLFSRTEKVSYSLAQMVAAAIDHRRRIVLTGEAKMVALGGEVVGPAAPDFVTRIFPGLNLQKYKYRKMTGFSQFNSDGTAEYENIFVGAYNVYMTGVVDANNFGKFSVGLVLLTDNVSAQWQHDWKQGRMPMLRFQGTIVDGEIIDGKVSYPWPNESLGEIFIKNNLIYRAWLNYQAAKAGEIAR